MKQALYKFEEWLAMAFFAMTSVAVFVGALSRTLGTPLVWSVDLAQLMFAWACVLGADLALKHNGHVVIDIAVKRFPPVLQSMLGYLWNVVIVIFLGMLVWYGIKLSLLNTQRSMGDLGISYAWVTVTIPVGAVLMIITTLGKLFDAAAGKSSIAIQGHDGDAI